jgi:hypothetical protein
MLGHPGLQRLRRLLAEPTFADDRVENKIMEMPLLITQPRI